MGAFTRSTLLLVIAVLVVRRQTVSGRRGSTPGEPPGTTTRHQDLRLPNHDRQLTVMTVKRWMRPAAWFISPIAVPAWLAESVIRRRLRRFWEFDMWSGTYYLLGVVTVGLLLLACQIMTLRIIGFYILSATELLALLVVGALPAGQLGGYASSLRSLARRKAATIPRYSERTAIMQPLWAALTAYLYTTLYFAICDRLAYEFDHGAFTGISHGTHVKLLFEFYYATFASMVTLGYVPNITPTTPATQLLYMAQFAVSLGFLVLVFSVVVDRLVSRRA